MNSSISNHQKAFAVPFKELYRWDVKYFASTLLAHFPFVPLGNLVNERSERVSIHKYPEQTFAILGVNNVKGVFHAYDTKGKSIHQSYKKVYVDDFFYNPYRVNVGSIGIVPQNLDGNFTSPAYVVFYVDKSKIIPKFLELVMRSDWYNSTLRAATAGSVRQNLTIDLLKNLEIPLPPISIQKNIVAEWGKAQTKIVDIYKQIAELEHRIKAEFLTSLGLSVRMELKNPKAFALRWSELTRWGIQQAWREKQESRSSYYEIKSINKVCKTGTGGTPNRKHREYFGGGIPWVKTTEVRNEIITHTEETLSSEGLRSSKLKLYPIGCIIIAMYGQGATRGRTAKLGIEATTNQACLVLTEITPSILQDYLWFYLIVNYDHLRALASGNNQPNLSAELVKEFPIPIPPLDVQQKLISMMSNNLEMIKSWKNEAIRKEQQVEQYVEDMILR